MFVLQVIAYACMSTTVATIHLFLLRDRCTRDPQTATANHMHHVRALTFSVMCDAQNNNLYSSLLPPDTVSACANRQRYASDGEQSPRWAAPAGYIPIPTIDVQHNDGAPLTSQVGSLALETTLRVSAALINYECF